MAKADGIKLHMYDLDNYIKDCREKGFSDEQIKKALLDAGWDKETADKGFSSIDKELIVTDQPVLNKLPGTFSILGDAWRLYKKRFLVFIGIVLVSFLFILLAQIIGRAGYAFTLSLFVSKLFGGTPIGKIILLLIIAVLAWFVAVLIQTAVQIWNQASLLFAIKEKINILEAYKRGWKKIISYYWISILKGLIIVSLFIPIIILGIISLRDIDIFNFQISETLIILGIIFTLFSLVLLIIVTIWFSFAHYILIAEDIRGRDALLKSRQYVKGKWWAVFGRFLLLALIYLIVFLAIISIVVLLLWALNLINISGIASLLGGSIFILILPLVMMPLTVISGFTIYTNSKKLKGEVESKQSNKEKKIITALIILGLLIIISFIGYTAWSILKFYIPSSNYERSELEYNYEEDLQKPEEEKDQEEIQDVNVLLADALSKANNIENLYYKFSIINFSTEEGKEIRNTEGSGEEWITKDMNKSLAKMTIMPGMTVEITSIYRDGLLYQNFDGEWENMAADSKWAGSIFFEPFEQASKNNAIFVGKESIQEKDTFVVKFDDPNFINQETKIWIWEEKGIPLKIEEVSTFNYYESVLITRDVYQIDSLSFELIKDSIFEIK